VQEVHSAAEWATIKNGGGGSFGSANAVVVDFSATWCGPCQQIGPIFEKLSLQYPAVKFVKIDVDECQVRNRDTQGLASCTERQPTASMPCLRRICLI
jgi:thiol-disulfide isomerase/thioredoxin